MTHRKKLIEVALPLEAINVASAREKSIRHGHPSTLHLWWARRPLAAARAVIFASLVDDPDDPEAPAEFVAACKKLPAKANALINDTPRMRLFDFIEDLVQWESTTNEQVIGKARELILLSTGGNPPPLLDPFAGGGSIPLEAQRLGLEAHASDLNPVAVMINKAMIEIPPRFANRPPVNPRDRQQIASSEGWKGAAGLAADVRYYGEWMREKAWERIGHLYPKHNGETVIAWIWARTVKCPNPACGAQMPLLSTFELGKKKGKKAWLEPKVDISARKVSFSITRGEGKPQNPPKVGRGARFRCLVCGEIAPEDHIKTESIEQRMGAQLVAVATEGNRGRNYFPASNEVEEIAFSASPEWYPDQEMGRDSSALVSGRGYGFYKWADLFTKRQLTALTTFSDLITSVRQQIEADAINSGYHPDTTSLALGGSGSRAYSEAVTVYLSFAVDKCADYWSTIAIWHNGVKMEGLANTFRRQAVPMTWDFAEGNPFSASSGNWLSNVEWSAKLLEMLVTSGSGYAKQHDAGIAFEQSNVIISTDPPYYDNIMYADLSDYFYVWMRRNLRSVFSKEFATLLVPKEAEMVAAVSRFGGNSEAAKSHFEHGLERAFQNAYSATHKKFPVTVFYAFRQSEDEIPDSESNNSVHSSTGWETMLTALIQAGFIINGTWPARTEYTTNLKSRINALASSIVLVCRPRPEDALVTSRREFINMLRRELPEALQQMQSGNIAPVDLAQAAIGPGMAVYSRYSKVLEADGSPLTVRTALQIINQELDAYFSEQEGDVDADTRFAIAWFDQYGFDDGVFGQADVLARAKNTSV